LIGLSGFALWGTGCAYMTAVPSVQGRAYVAKMSITGSTFWNCDATTGAPVCYQVVKQPAPAAATPVK
jgi:hypothetical protein